MGLVKKAQVLLQGKKTYIFAGIVIAIGVFAVLDNNASNDFVGFGFITLGLSMCGLGAKADRQHAEMLAHVAQTIVDAVRGEKLTPGEIQQAIGEAKQITHDVEGH